LVKKGFVKEIIEVFGISKENIYNLGFNENSVCNGNIFALTPKVMPFLQRRLDDFKKEKKGDRKAESLLPVEISALIKEDKMILRLYESKEGFIGITNPEDEGKLRGRLIEGTREM
jgi:hypothetical protein